MATADAINWTAIGTLIAGAAVLITVLTLVALRGGRLAKMESDISYLRRDMDTVLKYFKLVPAQEQDARRKR